MNRRIYVDLDGVLADFDLAARMILGEHPRAFEDRYGSDEFWKRLHAVGDFFATMRPMVDAQELWDFCCSIGEPTVLTGIPRDGNAAEQKRAWVLQHFNHDRVITCPSRDKRDSCRPGDILIDDWLRYRDLWEGAEGVFIHHTSAKSSIAAVKALMRSDLTDAALADVMLWIDGWSPEFTMDPEWQNTAARVKAARLHP
jgi:hypothetical protein